MKNLMRATIILLIVGAWASMLCADDLEAKVGSAYFHYSRVRITDFKNGVVHFTTSNGQPLQKKLDDIRVIAIKEIPSLGEAERLATRGKDWAMAVKAFDKAYGKTNRKWQRTLVALRRLRALDNALETHRAVKEWLALADATGAAPWVLSARPTRTAKKGYAVNTNAIAILERKRAAGKRTKPYNAAIAQVLMGLYNREGLTRKAADVAKWLASNGGGVPGNGGNGGQTVSGTPGAFATIETLLKTGSPQRALELIEKDLRSYKHAQLPKALLLRGRAQAQLASSKAGPDKRQLLLRAGLNFMRVVVIDPRSPHAPEALFEAGRIHTMLPKPNKRAARAAYKKVIADYGSAPAARRAREALKALKGK